MIKPAEFGMFLADNYLKLFLDIHLLFRQLVSVLMENSLLLVAVIKLAEFEIFQAANSLKLFRDTQTM